MLCFRHSFTVASDKKKIGWKTIVDVICERTTGGIKRFEDKICLTPDTLKKPEETEKLRQAIIKETAVDIFKQ